MNFLDKGRILAHRGFWDEGGIYNKNSEKADAKLEAMESAGIIVTKNPARLGITLKQSL